jgi:hypothetical protein
LRGLEVESEPKALELNNKQSTLELKDSDYFAEGQSLFELHPATVGYVEEPLVAG